MTTFEFVALLAATIATGLGAGVFLAFQNSIVSALEHVDDDAYVAIFQSINRVIINPSFMATFLGSPLLSLVAIIAHWGTRDAQFALIVLGGILNLVNLAITIGGNVPLNEALERTGSVTGQAAAEARQRFEHPWNRLHTIRTVAWIAGFVCLAVACTMG